MRCTGADFLVAIIGTRWAQLQMGPIVCAKVEVLFLLVLISRTENRPGLCERERSFAAAVGAAMDSISAPRRAEGGAEACPCGPVPNGRMQNRKSA